jgi:hypothetical protein
MHEQRGFAAVAAHPDADWIASPSALLDADGTCIGRCPHQLPGTWLDLACARWTGVSLGPAGFWSRRALERTGELDTSLHYVMDVDYWIRLMRNGLLPTEVQQELAGARTHPGQKSNARHAMAWGIDVMRLNGKLRRGTLNQRERAMLRRYQAWTATRRMPRMIAGTLRARCRRRR